VIEPVVNAGDARAVRFGLLGPLHVVDATGQALPVPAAKQRIVLAALLLGAGGTVSAERMSEALWDVSTPPNAPAVMRNYVMRLRRALGPASTRVVSRPPGWAIALHDGDELDLAIVDRLWRAARAAVAREDWGQASALLTEALGCWRGEPLVDVPSPVLVRSEAGRLSELRLQLTEARIDAELRLGGHAGLLAELRRLTAENPLREHLRVQLMLACYRCGNQAAALDVYRDARETLTRELGVAPGPELWDMHQRILVADRDLMVTPADVVALHDREAPAGYQHGLPPTGAALIGREAELAILTSDQVPASVVRVISGMPGVGKTAIAVQAAYLLARDFPDRQIFIDLHGYTPGRGPVSPADALAELITATGVDNRFLPDSLSGRSAMWRDRLAGRRGLLVLDNAASSAQITPLLPASGDCLVLVTSRRQLADLPGAVVPVRLPILSQESGREMFTALTQLEPSVDLTLIDELTELAGHLPLAISLLARVYACHPSWTLADLITETRASLLVMNAERVTVSSAFGLSWRYLKLAQRRLLALLSLHPGSSIDADAAAALTGLPAHQVARQLDRLHLECLLTETGYRRYHMHDLIRAYAADQARTMLDDKETALVMRRLIGYYTHAARADEQSLAWARAERANLLACLDHATAASWQPEVVALTVALSRLLQRDGPWPLAIRLHGAAVTAARQLADRTALARCILELAAIRRLTGDFQVATEDLTAAVDLYRGLGDQAGEAAALTELSHVRMLAADFDEAGELIRQALRVCRAVGDGPGQARALTISGTLRLRITDVAGACSVLAEAVAVCRDLGDSAGLALALRLLGEARRVAGDYHAARHCLTEAIELSKELADRFGQANGLTGLGSVLRRTGDYPSAIRYLERGLKLHRDLGNRSGQANALGLLGSVRHAVGDCPAAIADLVEALCLHRQLGMLAGEASTLAWLGSVRVTVGDYEAAATELAEAVSIARKVGDRGGEATGLTLLARLYHARADIAQARSLYQQALDLAREIPSLWDEASSLAGLGRCARDEGDSPGALSLLMRAHQLFQQIEAAEAAEVAAELTGMASADLK
jgi:DNA-binding SARP family transcriptional activator/tetratricopeptide (TPR) repeat protein